MVGRDLVSLLYDCGEPDVVAVLRSIPASLANGCKPLIVSDLSDPAACETVAARSSGQGTLIHLAALTPATVKSADDYQRVNAGMTEAVMRAAVAAGVPRVIYLSSTHACGALTAGRPIDEDSPLVDGADAYGASKFAGETIVKRLALGSQTRWTIVRAPLVYGPGVKGSLAALTRAVMRGVPLPFASITANARDMIGQRNLAAFLQLCIRDERAANQAFAIRDGVPVSTRQLIEEIAAAAGRSARLVPVPPSLLKAAAQAAGAGQMIDRLAGDHRVNDAKARQLLGWVAPKPMAFDVGRMVSSMQAI